MTTPQLTFGAQKNLCGQFRGSSSSVLTTGACQASPCPQPYKALAELESLVDLARNKADARTKRFSTMLRQCCPLLGNPQFQSNLLKSVRDIEGVKVVKAIQKSLHPSALCWPNFTLPRLGFPHRSPEFCYGPRPTPTCFNCHRRGHIARFCPKN